MADQAPGPPNESNHDRLNGWKEIAAHFGKSVRTVQRWERELSLPVHRIRTAGGEIVYAFRGEIEQWQAGADQLRARQLEHNGGHSAEAEGEAAERAKRGNEVEEIEEAKERKARWWRGMAWGAAGIVVIAVAVGAWMILKPKPQPANWRIEGNRLVIADAENRKLWEHVFPSPLVTPTVGPGLQLAEIADLDGDGRNELIFRRSGKNADELEFLCFNADGSVRFRHEPKRSAVFGGEEYASPYYMRFFVTPPNPQGGRHIWVAAEHNLYFPSLVQKLDARGNVVGEFWTNGHITYLKYAEIGGRRYMLVGTMNNEHYSTALAVLDFDNPSGSVPALKPAYRCDNCPTGRPLKYFVFPRTEFSLETNGRPIVTYIRVEPSGMISVDSMDRLHGMTGDPPNEEVHVIYTLSPQFQVIQAESDDPFRKAHAKLEMIGRLKHRYGPGDERRLWPVLEWDGEKFVARHNPDVKSTLTAQATAAKTR